MKKVVIPLFIILLLFSSCSNPSDSTPSSSEPSKGITTEETDDNSSISTTHKPNSGVNFPFEKPNFGEPAFDNGSYAFKNVTSQELEKYVESLISHGYIVEKNEYTYYLEKDNILIRITNSTLNYNQFNLDFYEGMTEARAGALTCSDAIELIGNNTVAAIEINVPGLYEKTGAQLFYTVSANQDSVAVWPLKYITLNQKVLSLDTIYDDFIMCDVDIDGKYELLYLADGGTSGVFSFIVNALGFENGSLYMEYSSFFSNTVYYPFKFEKISDTEIYLCDAYYSDNHLKTSSRFYKIEIENNNIVLNKFVD